MNLDQSEFGECFFECEKYPDKEAIIRANGGWGGIVATYLIFIPLGSITPTAFIAAALGWLAGDPDPKMRPYLIGLYICVIFLLLILSVFLWKRSARYAREISIRLFDNGMEIQTSKKTYQSRYDDIRDVYFGTKSKLAHAGFSVGSFVKPSAMKAAVNAMNNRLSFEFKNGEILRIPLTFAYFREDSIAHLFDCLGQKLDSTDISK